MVQRQIIELLEQADNLLKQNKLDKAEVLYRKALEKDRSFLHTWHQLGVIALQRGHYKEADIAFQQVIMKDPSDIDATINLGISLYHQKHYHHALSCLMRGIELDAKNSSQQIQNLPIIIKLMGISFAETGRVEQAIQFLKESIKARPDDHDSWIWLGLVYLSTERYLNAEEAYEKALQLAPTDLNTLTQFSTLLMDQNRLDEAEIYAKKAIEVAPNSDVAWNNMGTLHSRKNHSEEAVKAFRRSTELNPDYTRGIFNLYSTLIAAGRIEEGNQLIDAHISEIDEKLEKWMEFLREAKRFGFNEVIDKLDNVLIYDHEKVIDTCLTFAGILQDFSYFDKALIYVQKRVRDNPESAFGWFQYGSLLIKQGKNDEALELIKKSVKIDPKLVNAWMMLGYLLASQQKFKEAEKAFKKAIKVDPNHTLTYQHYTKMLMKLGKPRKAKQILEQGILENLNDNGLRKTYLELFNTN